MLFCVLPSCVTWWFVGDIQTAQARSQSKQLDANVRDGVSLYLTTYLDAATRAAGTAFPYTSTPTITPTYTPSPTGTQDLPRLTFRLSFYDPNIGREFPDIAHINCLEWDYNLLECMSKVNNGLDDYHVWYRRGAACSAPLSIGQRFKVINPVELARISPLWTCIDRGGAIVGDYIDFMLDYPSDIWTGYNLNDFPWSVPVVVELLP